MDWLAEAAADPSGLPDYVTQLLQWGPPGVIIILIVTGVFVTKGHLEQTKQERDEWRAAYERERDAHAKTREAYDELSKIAASTLEGVKTTNALLTNLGHVSRREDR